MLILLTRKEMSRKRQLLWISENWRCAQTQSARKRYSFCKSFLMKVANSRLRLRIGGLNSLARRWVVCRIWRYVVIYRGCIGQDSCATHAILCTVMPQKRTSASISTDPTTRKASASPATTRYTTGRRRGSGTCELKFKMRGKRNEYALLAMKWSAELSCWNIVKIIQSIIEMAQMKRKLFEWKQICILIIKEVSHTCKCCHTRINSFESQFINHHFAICRFI